jgi:hypothetical protein
MHGHYSGFNYFLPFVLWVVAVRNPHLTMAMRSHLLEMAFWIFYNKLQDLQKGLAEGISQIKHKGDVVYFASESALIRYCNTLLGLMVALKHYPSFLGMDRLGTHPLENFFGFVRLGCKYDHTWYRMLNVMAKGAFVCETVNKMGFSKPMSGRDNLGGTRIGKESSIMEDPGFCSLVNLQDFLHYMEMDWTDREAIILEYGPGTDKRYAFSSLLEILQGIWKHNGGQNRKTTKKERCPKETSAVAGSSILSRLHLFSAAVSKGHENMVIEVCDDDDCIVQEFVERSLKEEPILRSATSKT